MKTQQINWENFPWFDLGGYRFRYGHPTSGGNTVWMWNGYYWQVIIDDCTDLEQAKEVLRQRIAENGRAE